MIEKKKKINVRSMAQANNVQNTDVTRVVAFTHLCGSSSDY